jgi:RNA polymerase sigma-70 factor (ECF subfamily)
MQDGGREREVPAGTFVTVTSTTLLDGLRDPGNQTIWDQFVDRYRPLVVQYGRRLGLSGDDAEDVAQASLMAFCEGYRRDKYRRERGRLREWLFGIVHNQVRNWQRRQGRRGSAVSDTKAEGLLAGLESSESLEQLWDEEWRAAVARACLEQVRLEVQEATFQAFERFAIEGRPAEEVAAELGLTPNAVYGAKRRILRRVRELRPLMEDAW